MALSIIRAFSFFSKMYVIYTIHTILHYTILYTIYIYIQFINIYIYMYKYKYICMYISCDIYIYIYLHVTR